MFFFITIALKGRQNTFPDTTVTFHLFYGVMETVDIQRRSSEKIHEQGKEMRVFVFPKRPKSS